MAADSTTDVLVLRRGTHGMPVDAYAKALRNRLPDRTVQVARTPTEERELIADVEFATGMDLSPSVLDAAESLSVFACAYAGTGHLPRAQLAEQGVTVTNASGVHGPNIAEHVIGAILADVRRFDEAYRRQERSEWRHYQAGELHGDTVTIVGLGAIGQAVAERLDAFGVDTIGVRYTPSKGGPTDEVVGFDDEAAFEDALARSEWVVFACPLTDETEGLIGREELLTMPENSTIVNVARGPVIDTDALVWALRGNQISGAALDVTDPEPLPPEHPLWSLGNVRITPHNAGHTPAYYDRLSEIVAENVRRFDRGEELQNRVER